MRGNRDDQGVKWLVLAVIAVGTSVYRANQRRAALMRQHAELLHQRVRHQEETARIQMLE